MKVIGVEVRARQYDCKDGDVKQELAIWPLEFIFPAVAKSPGDNFPVMSRELEVTFHTTVGDFTAAVNLPVYQTEGAMAEAAEKVSR